MGNEETSGQSVGVLLGKMRLVRSKLEQIKLLYGNFLQRDKIIELKSSSIE